MYTDLLKQCENLSNPNRGVLKDNEPLMIMKILLKNHRYIHIYNTVRYIYP